MPGFGANLKAARERKSLTQKELGKAVKVAENTVARWERTENKPSDPAHLGRLAAALDTTIEALLGDAPVRSADDEAYRLGLYHAAKELRELAARLESGGPDVDARHLMKAGEDAGEGVGVQGVQKGHKGANRGGKVRNRGQHDRLPKK